MTNRKQKTTIMLGEDDKERIKKIGEKEKRNGMSDTIRFLANRYELKEDPIE